MEILHRIQNFSSLVVQKVYGIWKITPQPPDRTWLEEMWVAQLHVVWLFVKKNKCYAYDFFTYFKNYHGSGGPKELSFDLFLKGAKWKLLVLGGFNAYIRKFWLSFHKVFDSNILLTSCRYQSFDYKCPGYP